MIITTKLLVSVFIILTLVAVLILSILIIGMENLEIEPEISSNSTYSIHASDIITDLDGWYWYCLLVRLNNIYR